MTKKLQSEEMRDKYKLLDILHWKNKIFVDFKVSRVARVSITVTSNYMMFFHG